MNDELSPPSCPLDHWQEQLKALLMHLELFTKTPALPDRERLRAVISLIDEATHVHEAVLNRDCRTVAQAIHRLIDHDAITPAQLLRWHLWLAETALYWSCDAGQLDLMTVSLRRHECLVTILLSPQLNQMLSRAERAQLWAKINQAEVEPDFPQAYRLTPAERRQLKTALWVRHTARGERVERPIRWPAFLEI